MTTSKNNNGNKNKPAEGSTEGKEAKENNPFSALGEALDAAAQKSADAVVN